jgi:hypothetical protein
LEFDDYLEIVKKARSFKEFAQLVALKSESPAAEGRIFETFERHDAARRDFNDCRRLLDLSHFRMARKREAREVEVRK